MKRNIFKEVSDSLGIDEKDVEDVYKSTWLFIREKFSDLPLKDGFLTEDEFNKLRTTFNLPGLGKFGCDYNNYKRIRGNYLKKHKNDQDEECSSIDE